MLRGRSNAISSGSGISTRPGVLSIGGHRAPISTPQPVHDPAGMDNARLGVVYLFSKIQATPNIMSVALEGILGMTAQALPTEGKAIVDGTKSIVTTFGGGVEKVAGKEALSTSPVQAFKAWAEDILKKLIAELKAKFKEPKFVVGELKGLVVAFVRYFAKEAAPYVKGVMDMVKGLAKATPVIITKFKTWLLGRNVTLVEGHPALMVSALKSAMTVSILEGLYIALKGAVEIALTTVTAGAAALAKVVIAFVEAAVKIVWRMFELFRLENFCDWCRTAFAQKDSPNAPHKNAVAFAKVYKKYSMSVPIVAALTLNSGICGDKMRFICLYAEDGSIISQKNFNAGVAMIDGLKPFAGGLLRTMGVSLVIKDDFVKKLVDKAKAEPEAITPAGKVARFVNDVLTL